MIKDKKLSCTNLKKTLSLSGGCCKPELQGGLALSKETQGQSVPPCIAFTSKSHKLNTRLYFKSVPKRHCGTFCLYLSIPSPFVTITEDGDTPLDLIHPKPHGSSTFLTMFIDILMGSPLINTWIKTNYLLPWPHVKNAQKSALSSHSRSISTFSMTPCVLVIYWE